MEKIKVSVIIPVYNAEQYLEQALNSVISQKLSPVEILCVNDGSTDHSEEILHEYEKACSNLLVVSTQNRGPGFARNLGLRLARGEAVCFLDPDDYYPDNGVLEELYLEMAAHQVKLCGGSAMMLRGDQISLPLPADRKYTFETKQVQLFQDYQWSYGFWRFLYDRHFLLENRIYFPDYRRYQDPPFFVKAMIKAGRFLSIPRVSYIYRVSMRPRAYTLEETRDALCGITDVLHFSYENGLEELNRITAEHMNTWPWLPIVKGMLEGCGELEDLLKKAHRWILKDSEVSKTQYYFKPEQMKGRYSSAKALEQKLLAKICHYPYLILYGAGEVGTEFARYLRLHSLPVHVAFAVTNRTEQMPDEKEGIKLLELKEFSAKKDQVFVLVTTRENLHVEMEKVLQEYDFPVYEFLNYEDFLLYSMRLEERNCESYDLSVHGKRYIGWE